MIKNIIHNPVFRIFTPLFYGTAMYILILLIFDSISQLSENFFSIEVILCIVITYLIFESLRLYALLIEKNCPDHCEMFYRLLIQVGGSIIISFAITSLIITFYFTQLVGFSSYRTESIVFNAIFIFTGVLYNMIYFSFFYLNRINVSQLEQEEVLRKNAEIELNTYKNKINPGFLYSSLETLIGLSKQNIDKADQFILKLSDVYRNILSSKNTDLTFLREEIKISETFVEIVNYKYGGNLKLIITGNLDQKKCKVISGTLVVIIEDIINRSVINPVQPLQVTFRINENTLTINHTIQNRLVQEFTKKTELKLLKKAYLSYGQESIVVEEKINQRNYHIPLFELDES